MNSQQTSWLKNLEIEQLTAMQKDALQTIPQQHFVQLLAPTGTGKTVAFLLPLLQQVNMQQDTVQAVIMSPSRELAIQTCSVVERMRSGVRVLALYGGRPAMEEHARLRHIKPQVVVVTPGRMLDHLDKGNVDVAAVQMCVIDEFDKMLDIKFRDEVFRLVKALRHAQHVVLVSATDDKEAVAPIIALHGLPLTIQPEGQQGEDGNLTVPSQIRHWIVRSPERDKLETLRRLLPQLAEGATVVFVAHRESADRVGTFLRSQGFVCSIFHGGLEQEDRERALFTFSNGASNVLVSTDLSARGLDISELRSVVHYHLPQKRNEFVHRCGRTGRWTSRGDSYLLVGPEETVPDFVTEALQECDLTNGEQQRMRPQPPNRVALYIGKGKEHKICRGDVVGFLCRQGGLNAGDIYRVDIRPRCAYALVSRSVWQKAVKGCDGAKIKGIKTRVERMNS